MRCWLPLLCIAAWIYTVAARTMQSAWHDEVQHAHWDLTGGPASSADDAAGRFHGQGYLLTSELQAGDHTSTNRHLLQQPSPKLAGKSGSVLAWGDLSRVGPTPPQVLSGKVVKASAGRTIAVALLDNGEVVAWSANNAQGQADVPPAIQGQVVDISAGAAHALALLSNGSVVAWGFNNYNQTTVPAYLRPGGSVRAAAVVAGFWHSLALLTNGTVVGWGHSDDIFNATYVPAAAQSNVTSIATGVFLSVAVRSDGTLVQWGFNSTPAVQQGVQAATVGTDQVVALLRNGTVVTWGWGAPRRGGALYPDILLEVLALPPAAKSNITAVSANENVTLALRDTGEVLAWGHDSPGAAVVSELPSRTKSDVIAVSCGSGFALALVPGIVTAPPPPPPPSPPPPHPPYPPAPPPYQPASQGIAGSVLVWGDASHVEPLPANVTSGRVIKISAGAFLAMALLDTHEVVVWTANNSRHQADVPPSIQGKVADISAGGAHAMALLMDGSVAAWGSKASNQSSVPPALQQGGSTQAIAIAAGYAHSLALLANGTVVAWGYNISGQATVPREARRNVTAIAASGSTSIAVLSDGSLVEWGSTSQSSDVYQIGVLSVAVGLDQVVALLRNGSVVSYAAEPVLYQSILDAVTGVPPAARSNVVAVSASENVSMALRDTGEAVAWGWTPTGLPISPVPPAARSNVIAISAGYGYAMALVASPSEAVDGNALNDAQSTARDGSNNGVSLSTGVIAGIVIGAVAGVAVITTGILLLLRQRSGKPGSGNMRVYKAQMSSHYAQALKGTAVWDALTKVLRPKEAFMRSVAHEYSWMIGSEKAGALQNVEAGVNDTQLDTLTSQQAGSSQQPMLPVIELSRSDLRQQVHLMADGLLGRGATALVFKCLWPSRFGPNSVLAIKVLKDGSDSEIGAIQSFAYEAKLLAAMQHPNVVRVYGYCLEPPTVCIILELLPTSLKQRLYGLPSAQPETQFTHSSGVSTHVPPGSRMNVHNNSRVPTSHTMTGFTNATSKTKQYIDGALPTTTPASPTSPTTDALVTVETHPAVATPMPLLEIVRTSTDIAAGLAYLHSQEEPTITEAEVATLISQISQISSPKDKRIVHRDLKPANILLNSQGAAKITDFGLAWDHDHTTVVAVNMGAGTVQYMAPEQLIAARANRVGVSATNRVDVYSLGMMMWEMLAGQTPWKGKSEDVIFALVMNHRRPPLPGCTELEGEHVATKDQIPHVPGVHDHPLLPQLTRIIQACWNQRDRQRPTAAAVHNMLTQLLQQMEQ